MMEIWTEQQARKHLLPPNDHGLVMVLFVSDMERQHDYIERYMESVRGLELHCVVVETDPMTHGPSSLSDWFGLVSYPTLATIYDGMLLAIECDCAQGSCADVMHEAIQQYRTLVEMEA